MRAIQEIDYGRRGRGDVFGAFRPATGAVFTAPYAGRTIANWVAFLEQVDGWLDAAAARVYAILDNLSTHRALDVFLWALAHPRGIVSGRVRRLLNLASGGGSSCAPWPSGTPL